MWRYIRGQFYMFSLALLMGFVRRLHQFNKMYFVKQSWRPVRKKLQLWENPLRKLSPKRELTGLLCYNCFVFMLCCTLYNAQNHFIENNLNSENRLLFLWNRPFPVSRGLPFWTLDFIFFFSHVFILLITIKTICKTPAWTPTKERILKDKLFI